VILVDSSVWIDYFRGAATPEADTLDALLGTEPLATGDLILTEVLQGFAAAADFARARKLLMSLTIVHLGGVGIAVKAAQNFRRLRARRQCAQNDRCGHRHLLHRKPAGAAP
jgi:predicted nucleic acid-binding protein